MEEDMLSVKYKLTRINVGREGGCGVLFQCMHICTPAVEALSVPTSPMSTVETNAD